MGIIVRQKWKKQHFDCLSVSEEDVLNPQTWRGGLADSLWEVWDRFFFFFNFLLMFCGLHITVYPCPLASRIPLSPCVHSLPLPTLLQIQTKFKRKTKNQTKQRQQKNFVMEAVVWPTEPHSSLFHLFIFTCKCSLPWVIGLAQVLWFLLLHQ